MGDSIKEWVEKAAKASNDFEYNNTDLKRRYLIRNIQAFNYIVSLIEGNQGSFGTGYPFYVLQSNLTGEIPVIKEQIRYNNELIKESKRSKNSEWTCGKCLVENYEEMPDLKQVCKPCPNMDNELKPRKIINRLPDFDMWMVCKDGHIEEAEKQLSILFEKYNIHTSDVNPVQTIKDMEEITESIKNGVMPKKFLPIDAHIIEYSKIKGLIEKVPATLEQATKNNQVPYLPIHPKSYRKTWQYDDEAYNFIYDYLSAFTEFNFIHSLNETLQNSRNEVIKTYSPEQLYKFLVQSATEPNKRRNKTPELSKIFYDRVNTWKPKKEYWMLDETDEVER